MIWDIVEKKDTDEDKEWAHPRKVLKGNFLNYIYYLGHGHFVEDLALS